MNKRSKTGIYFAHRLLRARDWQDRLELDQLCDWWRSGGAGICALIGIGGAGKTAIVERFLRRLPGVFPKAEKIPEDDSLFPPEGLFVFSFYDVPNPDSFFAELGLWLGGLVGDKSAKTPSYEQTRVSLQQAGPGLMVLDGFEKVQDDGTHGGVPGQIIDRRLSDFIIRAATGLFPQHSIVITTRVPIAELEEELPPQYKAIPIGQINLKASIALLRKRGVTGSDVKLRQIAKESGSHALTVDLVGGYIAEFGSWTDFKLGTAKELRKVLIKERDAQRRHVLRQGYKFARIAERYRDSLNNTDPAALSLLERVCLFRIGVDSKILAAIFIGTGKEAISGTALSKLNKKELKAKLDLLVEMRLLEAREAKISWTKYGKKNRIVYTVHPAVREGFLKGMDSDIAKLGHEAARKELMTSLLGFQTTSKYPYDSMTLDLLEEIVYHTLRAGLPNEAWDIYWDRIGGYRNLLWRVNAYSRGERICRAFAGGRTAENAPLPKRLVRSTQTIFINEWALYLQALGQLNAARNCVKRAIRIYLRRKNRINASICNRNLADILLLSGHLKQALSAANRAIKLARYSDDIIQRYYAFAYRGYSRMLRGNTKDAMLDFQTFMRHRSTRTTDQRTTQAGLGKLWYAILLAHSGQMKKALDITINNEKQCQRKLQGLDAISSRCMVLRSDFARKSGNFSEAKDLCDRVHAWAVEKDDKELLCWEALIQAKIFFDQAKQEVENEFKDYDRFIAQSLKAINEGLHIARDCGYSIYHIDLILLRARIALCVGQIESAENDTLIALEKGIHPKQTSGLPELLAASNPKCSYAWGITEGKNCLAEVKLLKAAQRIGTKTYTFGSRKIPSNVMQLIQEASSELKKCNRSRKLVKDPKVAKARDILERLKNGILTEYPLKPIPGLINGEVIARSTTEVDKVKPLNKRRNRIAKKHIFISYCHDNRDEVVKLIDDLKSSGESSWWDEYILPGRDWKHEIRQAMNNSYAFILCLSKEANIRATSGIFPEALDAIAAYREYPPGSIFLIPVRLSKCEIPPLEIDSTRTLDRLQYVDLFPPNKRNNGFKRLIKALKQTAYHP